MKATNMSSDGEDSAGSSNPGGGAGKTKKSSNNKGNKDVNSMEMDIDMTDLVRNYRKEQDEKLTKNENVDVIKSQISTEKRLFLGVGGIHIYCTCFNIFGFLFNFLQQRRPGNGNFEA